MGQDDTDAFLVRLLARETCGETVPEGYSEGYDGDVSEELRSMLEMMIRAGVYGALNSVLLTLEAVYTGVLYSDGEDAGKVLQILEHLVAEIIEAMDILDEYGDADILPGMFNDVDKPEA